MALTLTMREGGRFYVDGEGVLVTSAPEGEMSVIVQTKTGEHVLTDDRTVEVLPSVRVSVGSMVEDHFVRLAIEAPREMIILRDKHMRQQRCRTM